MFKFIVFVCALGLSLLSYGQDLVEVHHSTTMKSSSSVDPRSEITKQAVAEASAQYIKDMIGSAKYDREKASIDQKIVSNYLKYVPIVKVSNIQRRGEDIEADVFLKISIENLKQLLLKSGLLYETKGAPVVTPLISIIDKVNGRSYFWWSGQERLDVGNLKFWLEGFHSELKTTLAKKDFFLLEPVRWEVHNQLPEPFKTESPRTEDLLFISQSMKGSILIRGNFIVEKSKKMDGSYLINVQLEALQSNNGRVVAEVVRNYETEIGPFQSMVADKFTSLKVGLSVDLASQISEAWQKGTFGSSLVQLSIKGPLSYKELENFKSLLVKNVRQVRGLRERFLSRGLYGFEIDSSSGVTELATAIKGAEFPRYKVEVEDVRSNRLALNVIFR